MASSRPEQHLVLVGGGHAHVRVMTDLRDRPEPGTQVTLVSRDLATPYSGMLPGLIAGHYRRDEAQIDLARLAQACGIALVHAEAVGLDPARRLLVLRDREPVAYDVLSLDVGSTPALDVPGAREHALPVKPVEAFLDGLDAIVGQARRTGVAPRMAVVGGGAGGVETAISIAERMRAAGTGADLTLVTRGTLLGRFHPRARRRLRAALDRHRVAVIENAQVTGVEADRVVLADGRSVPCRHALWVTWAGAPAWLRETALDLDPRGFVAVAATLRSTNVAEVFAAGDVAAVLAHPREKAGVYAVRQGPPLAANLRRALRGEALRPFTPQRSALALIGTGEGRAVAARGPLVLEGSLVWQAKEFIDRRWIGRYQKP